MYDDNGDHCIATLHGVLLAPYLCDGLFSIITLMTSGNSCLFHKYFWTVYFGDNKENIITLPHSEQRKHEFLIKTWKNYNSKKISPRKKVALELLHHRLVKISTRSLMSGDTENIWQDIELRINPYPFWTSCQIYLMNKKARSKNPL